MKKRIYFTDFDGTITRVDTCDAMIEAFAAEGWQECVKKWEEGLLTTGECARELFKIFKPSPEELKEFLLNLPVDESFQDFCHYVQERAEQLYILSDGYEFNINLILDKWGFAGLPLYANRLVHHHGSWEMESPHYSEECGRCGTCKKKLVSTLKGEGQEVVYIGDGYSDTCACREADLVFAKGHLLDYCRTHRLPAVPFDTFAEVVEHLKKK